MAAVFKVHQRTIFGRRVEALARGLAALIPEGASVLDVGCGDGSIASRVMELRPDISVTGIDVLVREDTRVDVTSFDGETIPYGDDAFDVVMFVDVLHHTDDPNVLLREAARVARSAVVLKDHLSEGRLDRITLQLMDWVGNKGAGVVLPYNYWSGRQWAEAHGRCDLRVDAEVPRLPLYPAPLSWLFGRRLHILRRLVPSSGGR